MSVLRRCRALAFSVGGPGSAALGLGKVEGEGAAFVEGFPWVTGVAVVSSASLRFFERM